MIPLLLASPALPTDSSPAQAKLVALGRKVFDFEVIDLTGKPLHLSNMQKDPKVLRFLSE